MVVEADNMGIPTYADADSQAPYKDEHGITKNTLVQGEFGRTPAQAVKVTSLGVHFDNGEAHTHRQLAAAVEKGHMTVKGQRATR